MNHMSEAFTSKRLARIERFFAEDVAAFTASLKLLESEIDSDAVPQRDDKHHRRLQDVIQTSQEACRKFEQEMADDETVLRDVQDGFRRETEPWMQKSWFANRARTKPSGFAGDYEMLRKLYDMRPIARGIGGYLDFWVMDLPLAEAVRTRLAAMREFLIQEIEARDGDMRILDIASGPCREFEDWPNFGADRDIEVVALDSDPRALEFVSNNIALNESTRIVTKQYNALRTRSAATNRKLFGTFDMIYSVGLCDYLTDRHLTGMLSAWRETLKPGGVLYVAFKDCERYDKTPYQWHLDWFFFQRTEQDMMNLFEASGFDVDGIEARRDASGIIINFIDRSVGDDFVRIDDAEQSAPANPKAAGSRKQLPQ